MVERQVNIKARVEGIEEAAGNMATLQASARTTRKEIAGLKADVQDLSKALQELQANAKAVNTGIIMAASKVMNKQRKQEGTTSTDTTFNLNNIGKDDVSEEQLRTKILEEYQTQLDKNIKLQKKIRQQRVEYNALTGSMEITVPEQNKRTRKQQQSENEIDDEPVGPTPPKRPRTRRNRSTPAPTPAPFVPLQPPAPEQSYIERIDPNDTLEEKQAKAQRNIENAKKKRFELRAPNITPIKYKTRAEVMSLGYAKTYEDSVSNEDKNTGVLNRAGMDQAIEAIRAIRENDYKVIVSKIGREVVGGLAFQLKRYKTHSQADITNVGSKYYGVGAGDTMMDMFDEQMIKHGVDTATIPHAYPGAHKLYMRHGFVPENMQDVGNRTTRMNKFMSNKRFLEMDAPNIGPMGADTSELFKLLSETYNTGREEAYWKDMNKGTNVTPGYKSTVSHLSFLKPASEYKKLLTARYHTHLPHALAIPSAGDLYGAAQLPGIEGILSGAGNVLEMQVPENIKINKFVKEWEHIMLEIRKRGPQGKTNVQFQKTFQNAFLELAKKYKVKTSVYDIIPADARQQILRGFDNLVVDAPDISPLSFEALLEKEFAANPKITNKMAVAKIGEVFGTSISGHKIKAKMAELRKISKEALEDVVIPDKYGFSQAQTQAEQTYDPSYQPLVGQFIPPAAPFVPPAAHVQLTTPAILKESDEQILKFQHVFEELLGPRLHSKLQTKYDPEQDRTYGAFTVVIDADLSDPSEMLGHIKSSWYQALTQTDALVHPLAPKDDDWVRRTRTYEKAPRSQEEERQATKIAQLDAEIAMRKEERMKEREEEKQAASTWKQKLNEWRLERKKRDVLFKHFGGVSHVDFAPQTGWKRDEAGNIVPTGGAVSYPEEGKSDKAVIDANEILRRVRSKRVVDPAKMKEDIKEPASAIGKIIDQLVNKGGALGRLSWTFTSLAMSGLGVYFSLMSIVGMLQQGIMAVFNPLQNLQGIIQGYAMSVSQFGKDSPINLDNFFEQLFGDPDGIERITRAWKFLQGIMGTITTSLGAFGAKVLLDPEVQEALVGIVKELQNFLLRPETFKLVKDILLEVRKIMPDILNAFAYLGKLVQTVLLPNAKLFAQAWATSIVVMPIASLASAFLNVGKAIAFGAEQAFLLKKGIEGAEAASTMGMFSVGAAATSGESAGALLPAAGTAGMTASLTTVAAALSVLVVGLAIGYTAWIQNWNGIQEKTRSASKDLQETFGNIEGAMGNADTGGLFGAVGSLTQAFGNLYTMWMQISGSNTVLGGLWEFLIVKSKELTLAIYMITDALNTVAKMADIVGQAVANITGIKITSGSGDDSRTRKEYELSLDKEIANRATKRASGGPLRAGQMAIVGEQGPELLIPRGDVDVIPNNKIRFLAEGTSVGTTLSSGNASAYISKMLGVNTDAVDDNTDALQLMNKTLTTGTNPLYSNSKSLSGGPGSQADIDMAGNWSMTLGNKSWNMKTSRAMREQQTNRFGLDASDAGTALGNITPHVWNKPKDLGEYDLLNIDIFTAKMKDQLEENKQQTQILKAINTNVQDKPGKLSGTGGSGAGAGTAGAGGVWGGAGTVGSSKKPPTSTPTGTASDMITYGPGGGIMTASPYNAGEEIEEANPYHKPKWDEGTDKWAKQDNLTGDVFKGFRDPKTKTSGPGWGMPYEPGDSYGWDSSAGAPSVGYGGIDPYYAPGTANNGRWTEIEKGKHYYTDYTGKTFGPFPREDTSLATAARAKTSKPQSSKSTTTKAGSKMMDAAAASQRQAAKWQTATAKDFGYQDMTGAGTGQVGEIVTQGKDTFVRQVDGSLKLISSMAAGGLLTKGGLINAHAGEVIGPLGQVASTLAQAANISSTNNTATNQNITVNITITGDANKDVTDDMIRKIKRDLFGRGVV